MSVEEQPRLRVLNGIMEGWGEAARLVGVSERHVWQLLTVYRKEGAAALCHGNRGRPSPHAVPVEVRRKVEEVARGLYEDANHSRTVQQKDLTTDRPSSNSHQAAPRWKPLPDHPWRESWGLTFSLDNNSGTAGTSRVNNPWCLNTRQAWPKRRYAPLAGYLDTAIITAIRAFREEVLLQRSRPCHSTSSIR